MAQQWLSSSSHGLPASRPQIENRQFEYTDTIDTNMPKRTVIFGHLVSMLDQSPPLPVAFLSSYRLCRKMMMPMIQITKTVQTEISPNRACGAC